MQSNDLKPVRVAHILNTGGYSGAENVVITMIRSMRPQVQGIYVSPAGMIGGILQEEDIEHYKVPKLGVGTLRHAIREIKPDLIHAHDFTATVTAAFAGTGLPVISHLHNNSPWLQQRGVRSRIFFQAAKRTSKILTVSDAVMHEYVYSGRLQYKTEVVGNPIDFYRIDLLAGGASENVAHFDLAFFGRESAPKNPLFFLKIVQELAKNNPTIRAIMIGDGELHGEVAAYIQKYKLEQNVIEVGFQRNPYVYIKQADILCMPSLWEGFGLTAIEAMHFGLPVVCSGAGGLSNVVDESCGAVCNQDVRKYVNEIEELMGNREYYHRKSLGALKQAERYNNLNQYMGHMGEIYRNVLEKANRA